MAPTWSNESFPPYPLRHIPSFSFLTDDSQKMRLPRPLEQPAFSLADICPPPVLAEPTPEPEPTPIVRSSSPLFTEHSPSTPTPELSSHLLSPEPPREQPKRLCSPGDSGYGSESDAAGTPPPQPSQDSEELPRVTVPRPRVFRRVPPPTRSYYVPWALPTADSAPQLPSVPAVPQLVPTRAPRAKGRNKRKAEEQPSTVCLLISTFSLTALIHL